MKVFIVFFAFVISYGFSYAHGFIPREKSELQIYETYNVQSCANDQLSSESCQWTVQFSRQCGRRACPKMVIFFSGGQMSCPSPETQSSYLSQFVSAGYVAVCVKLFETPEGAQSVPYYLMKERMNTVISDIRGNSTIRKIWNGRELLFSGISHGATAPVIVMANSNYDSTENWKGSTKTGACFYDGIYDTNAHFSFMNSNKCFDANCLFKPCLVTCEKQMARYFEPEFGGCFTNGATCSCRTQPSEDSVVWSNPGNFSIKNWKLMECGSQMNNPCLNDAVVALPIQRLCNRLSSSGLGHSCRFESLPYDSHLTCNNSKTEQCITWFNSL